jgi:hypothetical protein
MMASGFRSSSRVHSVGRPCLLQASAGTPADHVHCQRWTVHNPELEAQLPPMYQACANRSQGTSCEPGQP